MSEESEAHRDGAKLQRNSGRGMFAKGDATWEDYVIDYKEYSKSFSVSTSVWRKACTDAFAVGLSKIPLIRLILDSDTRLTIVETSHFNELVDKAKRYDRMVVDRHDD